jgi:hypothetical protein
MSLTASPSNTKKVTTNFPENNSFCMAMLYAGKEISDFSPEELAEIMKYAPDYTARIECQKLFYAKVLKPLFTYSTKHPVIEKILSPKDSVKNILLMNLLEDAARQNMTDLCALTQELIKFINICKGRHRRLFKKASQRSLIEALINGNNDQEINYKNADNRIEQARESLFCSFNDQGVPSDESFTKLKERITLHALPHKDVSR